MIVYLREGDINRGVIDILVIESRFEIGQDSVTSVGIGHDLAASVHESFFKHLLENPPAAFHEAQVHGLVIMVEIDPSSHPMYRASPFAGISHHNVSAFFIIIRDSHLNQRKNQKKPIFCQKTL